MKITYTILAARIKMTKVISGILVIEPFITSYGSATNIHCCWEIWKDDFTPYTTASGITQDLLKLALLLHVGGTKIK